MDKHTKLPDCKPEILLQSYTFIAVHADFGYYIYMYVCVSVSFARLLIVIKLEWLHNVLHVYFDGCAMNELQYCMEYTFFY